MRTDLRNLILGLAVSAGALAVHAEERELERVPPPNPACVQRLMKTRSSINRDENKDLVDTNHFRTWRTQEEYVRVLKGFAKRLEELKARGGIYVDGGAGFARAMVEIIEDMRELQPNGALPIQFIASSMAYPEPRWQMYRRGFTKAQYTHHQKTYREAVEKGDLRYVEGDIIKLAAKLGLQGKVDLITDFFGPAAYSHFSLILTAYLHMLKPGGQAIIRMPSLVINQPAAGDTSYGYQSTLVRYSKEATGFTVETNFQNNLLVITRNEGLIHVPHLWHIFTEIGDADHKERAEYEWIQTRRDWEQSQMNPHSDYYRGKLPPRGFIIPER